MKSHIILVVIVGIFIVFLFYVHYNKGKCIKICYPVISNNQNYKPTLSCNYLYLICGGEKRINKPTIIFESGFRNDSNVWTTSYMGKEAVFPNVITFARACAYDRPGTIGWEADKLSLSGNNVYMPRKVQDMVSDLHLLLKNSNVKPPYIMVGHSLGGLLVRLYASTYPNEVVGLVLVDALSEYLRQDLEYNKWEAYRKYVEQITEPLKNDKYLEKVNFDDASSTMAYAQKINPLPSIPLTVISRGKSAAIPPGTGITTETLEKAWSESQTQLTKLSNKSNQIIATQSEHYIQFFQPELVINAIYQMYSKF